MDEKEIRNLCASKLLEVTPLLRGSINAHIHHEVNRSAWVTPGQTRILYLIDQGTSSISDLAAQQKSSAPTISRQVEGLVEKGLVHRERQCSDRRVVTLALTTKGEEILKGVMTSARDWIAEHFGGLDIEEINALIHALDLLQELFKTEPR